MTRPKWITPAGDLGVIAAREFYNFTLEATVPVGAILDYAVVSGSLPRGLRLLENGVIEGVPTFRKFSVAGRRLVENTKVVSKFSVRARSTVSQVTTVIDRTFVLTVAGQDIPRITITNDYLGEVYDGKYFELPITAVDLDDDAMTWSVKAGELPPGLSLNTTTGVLSGNVNVTVDTTLGVSGWENIGWDVTSWDFQRRLLTKTYLFSIAVTDGIGYDLRNFSLRVVAKNSLTADNTNITVDSMTSPTSDADDKRNPVMITKSQDLGVILHDNYFAFKFDAVDFDNDALVYSLVVDSGDLSLFDSGNLTFDTGTGWLSGFIPAQALIEQEYRFTVRAAKSSNSSYTSTAVTLSMLVIGDLGKFIKWQVPDVLGTVTNGGTSELFIRATSGLLNQDGTTRTLYYRLVDDYDTGIPVTTEYYQTGNGSRTAYSLQTAVDTNGTPIPNFGLDYLLTTKARTVSVNGVTMVEGVDYFIKKLSPTDIDVDDQVAAQTISSEIERITFNTPPVNNTVIKITITKGFVASPTSSRNSGRLPQGLRLDPTGLIVGNASFNGFTLDSGACTFDVAVNRSTGVQLPTPTTFDREFTVTVEVYDIPGDISVAKTFTIIVDFAHPDPYSNLYLVARPPIDQRLVFRKLIKSIDPTLVYRHADPNFGISSDIRMLMAPGIKFSTGAEMQAALERNHYEKKLGLGKLRTARAVNLDGTVRYEVVYIEVRDRMANELGISISSSVELGGLKYLPPGNNSVIYPNSIENMRDEVYRNVGRIRQLPLPGWMSSKQANGAILGLINAVVICYTQPGASDEVVFNIERVHDDANADRLSFNSIEFMTDRYVWDNSLSKFYNPDTEEFTASNATTFDRILEIAGAPPLVATVNYAVRAPFSSINGRDAATLANAGVFDGISTGFVGSTIIFARQEGYDDLAPGATGWERYTHPFAFASFDSDVFDAGQQVPGYFDPVDERSGVYRVISVDGVIFLTLELVVLPGERVDVLRGGLLYGGRSLIYDTTTDPGHTYPHYTIYTAETTQIPTTFDSNGTRFRAQVDVYARPDQDDQYLKFPRVGVFA
jgi:hypothetical protein